MREKAELWRSDVDASPGGAAEKAASARFMAAMSLGSIAEVVRT